MVDDSARLLKLIATGNDHWGGARGKFGKTSRDVFQDAFLLRSGSMEKRASRVVCLRYRAVARPSALVRSCQGSNTVSQEEDN